ncbi:MAG: alpha/beta hydrolase [Anaerolineae bacterium]|nr:alpha/beta hydrolase [Thermoflexales bacterium]MDW8406389.1 alpha/beta hydrolase [Anaerolineae bacterium]
MCVALAWLMWVAITARPAHAEIPVLEPGDYTDVILADPTDPTMPNLPEPWFMWFVMGELERPDDVDLVTFEYEAGELFRAKMFIPAHEDLRHFAPIIALIGPGLPAGDAPFPLPPGMGILTATSDNQTPYFDIFTQMTFWPRAEMELHMPQTGRYYMAVYGEPVGRARYALDIGIMETYAPWVLIKYPLYWWQVREFLQWGHLPAAMLPLLVSFGFTWITRRRNAPHIHRSVWLVGLFGVLWLAAGLATWFYSAGNVALTVLVLVLMLFVLWIAGAHVFTPLRERLTPREFARTVLGDERFVTLREADGLVLDVWYSDDGPRDGPPVLLMHGFGAYSFTWRHIRRALLEAGFRVITADQPGYGASDRPRAPVYDTRRQAERMLAVLDALGIHRAHVVGHSFGGRMGMQIAIIAPQRVLSLVAISPEAFATTRPGIAQLLKIPFLGYVIAFYTTLPALITPFLKAASQRTDWITPEVTAGYSAPMVVKGSVWGQVWQGRSPKDGAEPVPHNLARVTAPTLLVWGAGDPIFPVADGRRLVDILPAARLHVIDGVGHLAHEEAPDDVAQALIAFLRDRSA